MKYYRDIWARISHTLVPITNITSSKIKFKWTEAEQDVETKLGERPRPLRGLDPSLVPEPRTQIPVT